MGQVGHKVCGWKVEMEKSILVAALALTLVLVGIAVFVRWSSTPGMEDFVVNGCPAGTPACGKGRQT